jgi:hypothetical protein
MKTLTITAVLAAGVAFAGAAQAQTVAALVGDDTLAIVDAGKRKVERTVKVMGVSGRLVGIDVRPSDGMLYGLAEDGTVVTIDPMSGKATQKSKLETMLAPGTMATVDFNPAADRLRVIGSDGTNLRANVDDGKVTKDGNLKFAETDTMKGKTPKVIAGAYTNSVKGAKETVLYDVDAAGALLRQVPPNDGVLNTIGMLGVPTERVAFDIAPDGSGGNIAYLMAGMTLCKVDLTSGKATEAGRIEGASDVRDIAVMPSAM